MRLEVRAALGGSYKKLLESRLAIAEGGMMQAAGLAGRQVVARLRADVESAGLGSRLAKAWRALVYPKGQESLSPAVVVATKAPRLVDAYSDGATIRPHRGSVYLWIPTENVPGRRERNRRMSPRAVEEMFGDFEFVPSLTRPGVVLAVVPAVKSKSARGWTRGTEKQRASGRNRVRVPMFVLVRQVRVRKRLTTDAIFAEIAEIWPAIVADSLRQALADAPEAS